MTNDPRSALNRLIAAFEAHLDAAATGDELSPAVVAAENALQDAFFTYDDSLFTAYGIELPFEAFDSDGDDEDDDDDDEDYDDGEYDEDDDDYDDSGDFSYDSDFSSEDYLDEPSPAPEPSKRFDTTAFAAVQWKPANTEPKVEPTPAPMNDSRRGRRRRDENSEAPSVADLLKNFNRNS